VRHTARQPPGPLLAAGAACSARPRRSPARAQRSRPWRWTCRPSRRRRRWAPAGSHGRPGAARPPPGARLRATEWRGRGRCEERERVANAAQKCACELPLEAAGRRIRSSRRPAAQAPARRPLQAARNTGHNKPKRTLVLPLLDILQHLAQLLLRHQRAVAHALVKGVARLRQEDQEERRVSMCLQQGGGGATPGCARVRLFYAL
jgi:hypothetical protein